MTGEDGGRHGPYRLWRRDEWYGRMKGNED